MLLFLEDAAHLRLLRTLVQRIADDEGVDIAIEARNAVGGSGQALATLREYVRDLADGREQFSEVLVVAIDGNCHGVNERVAQIERIPVGAAFAGRCVCAVPDPHVEVWYLADGRSVAEVAGSGAVQGALPEYKCEPDRYKILLREVFERAGLSPPLGGTEFGDEIGEVLDIAATRRSQPSFERFVQSLTATFRQLHAAGL